MSSVCFRIYRRLTQTNRSIFHQKYSSSWPIVLKQAEKTVGYSTSFLNLRWLLSDEIANLASSVSKILGTNHPILKTAKRILIQSDVPSWGLVILLISKASVMNDTKYLDGQNGNSGILHTQRMVAEIVETLKTGIFFHKSLLLKQELKNLPPEIHQGNKIALLVGDYLITKSYQILAEINNSKVEEIISTALRDLCEEEFFGLKNEANEPIPSKLYSPDDGPLDLDTFKFEPYHHEIYVGRPKSEWTMRNCLGGAFLLGRGCHAAVMLGRAPSTILDSSFAFGVNLALACQARKDLNALSEQSTQPIEKVSAPVLFHLEEDASFDWKGMDEKTLRRTIRNGIGQRKTEDLLEEFLVKAESALVQFPESKAKESLQEMLGII